MFLLLYFICRWIYIGPKSNILREYCSHFWNSLMFFASLHAVFTIFTKKHKKSISKDIRNIELKIDISCHAGIYQTICCSKNRHFFAITAAFFFKKFTLVYWIFKVLWETFDRKRWWVDFENKPYKVLKVFHSFAEFWPKACRGFFNIPDS